MDSRLRVYPDENQDRNDPSSFRFAGQAHFDKLSVTGQSFLFVDCVHQWGRISCSCSRTDRGKFINTLKIFFA